MIGKVAIAVGVIAAGVISFQQYRGSQRAECLAQVARFQRAYTSDRPKSEIGPSDLRERAPKAEQACNEGRYSDAIRTINTAGMICRLNNGCGESAREKGQVIR